MSDWDGGLTERAKARCFPLALTPAGGRGRKQCCVAGRSSSSGPLREAPSWIRESSARLCDLPGSCSCERASIWGLRSGRVLQSHVEGGPGWEYDRRRLGDCERDCGGLDSQRRTRSHNGGGGVPGGMSYFELNEATISPMCTGPQPPKTYLRDGIVYTEIPVRRAKIAIYF
jgi:hypothetical protein